MLTKLTESTTSATFAFSSKTPLDYIAQGYWQDFLAARPIAGGMAYETQLHECRLDDSLASLQRIDMLLTQIRRDMAKSDKLNEAVILADDKYRNLLAFLAFYAGRVLAYQWQHTAQWYGQFELAKRYPELIVNSDDFYQHMAVIYRDGSQQRSTQQTAETLFFALEPIGLRLFGNIDRQFEAIQGGQVASGLYQAVSARLPDLVVEPTILHDSVSAPVTNLMSPNASSLETTALNPSSSSISISESEPEPKPLSMSNSRLAEPFAADSLERGATIDNTLIKSGVDKPDNIDSTIENSHKQTLSTNLEQQPTPQELAKIASKTIKPNAINEAASLTAETYAQSLIELNEIEVIQVNGLDDYQEACKILDQFERHIARQNKPRGQITFSQEHQVARQQALVMLQQAANVGHTAAMLRLAMYELLGEGLIDGKLASTEAGVNWVKQAATAQDSRAQRLLSRLYYQGIGVPQDMDNGKIWLEQAAKNGHKDAAVIVAQWQQAQALIDTHKQEQHSIKRYQLLIGGVIIGALLLIILL